MLDQPSTIFGVHSLTLYDRINWLPFGIIKVLGSLTSNFTGDFVDLNGGSNRYTWDSEPGNLDISIEGTVKEYHNMMFEKFLGASVTSNASEASGSCGTLTNKSGTLVEATTGIASASVESGEEANLKDALYVVKAVSTTEVDVYALTDVDFSNGASLEFQDNLLKITATPLTVLDSGGTVSVPNTGIELTGGSGTVAMNIGDTAYVYTRKINGGSDIITVGSSTQTFPEFGVLIASQKLAGGETFRGQFYRCKGFGFPVNMNEKEWSEADVTIKMLYDSCQGAVGEYTRVKGVAAC